METSLDPIVKAVNVTASIERAFELFTARAEEWWPKTTHSIAGDAVASIVFEPRVGGRVYEVANDGAESAWATVTAWEPPARFVLEWHVDPRQAHGEVEVTFAADGDGTRVELVHRGWEHCGEGAAQMRTGYAGGWEHILRLFAGAAADNDGREQ